MTGIEEKVIACVADVYGVDVSAITLETDLREELSNESMKMIAFLSSLEDELDITIEIREAGKLKTIRDFSDRATELVNQ